MSKKKITPQNGGFTLVELMVVVAVISILAAIGIPKMTQYLRKAKCSEVSQQAKWVIDAMREYEGSHELTLSEVLTNLNNTGGTHATIDTSGTSSLRTVVTTLGVIEGGRFKYEIYFGEDSGTLGFCAKAVSIDEDKTGKGTILFSSKASTNGQWETNMNVVNFITGDDTTPITAEAGGYCAADGTFSVGT